MGEGEPEAEEENVAGAAAVAAVTSGTTDSMPKPQNRETGSRRPEPERSRL